MPFGGEEVSWTPLFLIGHIGGAPKPPAWWSFSGLREFEECPRRWVLARTHVECFGGPIPQKPGKRTVEGILLHGLLESYGKHIRTDSDAPFRPRQSLRELLASWSLTNLANRRVDARALSAQVGIEEVLRNFSVAREYIPTVGHGDPCRERSISSGRRTLGSEVWMEDPLSRLRGKLDFVTPSEIVEFKSGDSCDWHKDQLRFYGALHVAATGRAVKRLRLVYGRGDARGEVILEGDAIGGMSLNGYRARADTADQIIKSGKIDAKPCVERCRGCHVRALCQAYWAGGWWEKAAEGCIDSCLMDYGALHGGRFERCGAAGYLRGVVCGQDAAMLVPADIADEVENHAANIRVLCARCRTGGNRLSLVLTQLTEFFMVG